MKTDVLILLPSDWASLEHHSTRWREVLKVWAGRDDMRICVASYPRYRRRNLVKRRMVRPGPSWLPDVTALHVDLPIGPEPSRLDGLGLRRCAAALAAAGTGNGHSRRVIATHPLWVPLALRLPAVSHGFDAFDDWAARSPSSPLTGRIADGYRRLASFDSLTVNSPLWQGELERRSGRAMTLVGNGVDVERFQVPPSSDRSLPSGPFAIYVGTVEHRVDITYLTDIARDGRVPVVVAGPAPDWIVAELMAGGVRWVGPQHPDVVPALLARAAVGLVPHRVNAFTRSMDPMKVLEYLAAGLPVVSTRIPLPAGTEPYVTVRDDPASFRDAVVAAARAPRPGPPTDLLAGRSWRRVADKLYAEHVA